MKDIITHIKRFGIDAPIVVRRLLLSGFFICTLSPLSFLIQKSLWFWVLFLYTLILGFSLIIAALWLAWSSIVLKPRILSKIVKKLELKGSEFILDLGCGRGIFVIEAAKHLKQGKAYGIDIWNPEDQSGNSLKRILENISLENLEENAEVYTGDISFLPFPDCSFDIVVSSLTIHNLSDPQRQKQAVNEMLRVLKPNAPFVIFDVLNAKKLIHYLISYKNIPLQIEKISSYCPKGILISGRNTGL